MYKLLIPILNALQTEASAKLKKEIADAITKLSLVIKYKKKISIPSQNQAINLREFFGQNSKQRFCLLKAFTQVLNIATSDEVNAPVNADEFTVFEVITTTYDNIREVAKRPVNDLELKEGRSEARRRLGAAAYLLGKQSQGEVGKLSIQGGIVIGWFKLKERVIEIQIYYSPNERIWYCNACSINCWYPGNEFWA